MNVMWVLARSAGLTATAALTAVMVLGILSSTDMRHRPWSRFMTAGLHRRVSYIAVCLLLIHIAAIVADNYVAIDVAEVFVPFVGQYQPFAVGLGAIACDLLLVVLATSIMMRRMPHAVWQVIHVLAYIVWPIAIVHGVLAGTDDMLTWVMSLTCGLAVGFVALTRAFTNGDREPRASPSAVQSGSGQLRTDRELSTQSQH